MRKSFIAGNWKMNLTVTQAVELAKALVKSVKDCPHRVLVAPNFTCLDAVSKVLSGSPILLGAQNMAFAEAGAYTGETSVLMLKDVGVQVVILGHSERRSIYGETDEVINQKVKLALHHGLEVILCVGETLEERESGKAIEVVNAQIEAGLKDVTAEELSSVTIAYEPVWAIGTGKTATPQDAQEVHAAARAKVGELYCPKCAENLIIQYGGSMNAGNAKELMAMPDVDGGLIGGASLKVETFLPIVNYDK